MNENHKTYRKGVLFSLLFFLCTFGRSFLTIGRRFFSPGEGTTEFFHKRSFDPTTSPSKIVFLITSAVRALLYIYLFNKGKKTKKRNPLSVNLFFLFIILRLVSLISFPYGKREYLVYPSNAKGVFELTYDGFSFYDRIVQFVYELLFALYFLFVFNYGKKFPDRTRRFLSFLLKARIAFGVITILYSVAFEQKERIESVKHFLDADFSFYSGVKSFTSYKNVAGFFVFRSLLSCLILFGKRENFVYLVIYFRGLAYLLILQSRTPLVLLLFIGFLYGILYPIFRRKKNKGYSIAFILIDALCIISALALYILKKDTIIEILKAYFRKGTRESRNILIKTAYDLFNGHTDYLLLGRGKLPFEALLNQYRNLIGVEYPVRNTSHNAYFDIRATRGVFALLFVLLRRLVLFIKAVSIAYKNPSHGIARILSLIAAGFYSLREPRSFFLREGNVVFFLLVILLPILRETNRKTKREAILTDRLSVA